MDGDVQAQRELHFANRIQANWESIAKYADQDLQDAARSVVPVERLHGQAHEALALLQNQNEESDFQAELAKALQGWFKNEFFKWLDKPLCKHCPADESRENGTQFMTMANMLQPTQEELFHGGMRVEGYRCSKCTYLTRFPRFNSTKKLLETRQGRCGEWANVFTLLLISLGFETRYVVDFTDHVWNEIWSDRLKRWVHLDCCEGPSCYDTPLVYECGWGKKLTYIIAYHMEEGCKDVTLRYTKDNQAIMDRRRSMNECRPDVYNQIMVRLTEVARNKLSKSHLDALNKRDESELFELLNLQRSRLCTTNNITIDKDSTSLNDETGSDGVKPEESLPRQSGATEWRQQRGEMGDQDKDSSSKVSNPRQL